MDTLLLFENAGTTDRISGNHRLDGTPNDERGQEYDKAL